MNIKEEIEERALGNIPHDPDVYDLCRRIGYIDQEYNYDSLGLKFGGDGDPGEELAALIGALVNMGEFAVIKRRRKITDGGTNDGQ